MNTELVNPRIIKTSWKEYLNDKPFAYFHTVTLNHKSMNHKEDIERYLKVVHRKLFSNNYKKKHRFLSMVYVMEIQDLTTNRPHYHFIIENDDRFEFNELVDAVIYASTRCNSISDIPKKYEKELTLNTYLTGKRSSKVHMNLVEIKTEEDKERIVKYLLKEVDSDMDKLGIFDKKYNFPIMVAN